MTLTLLVLLSLASKILWFKGWNGYHKWEVGSGNEESSSCNEEIPTYKGLKRTEVGFPLTKESTTRSSFSLCDHSWKGAVSFVLLHHSQWPRAQLQVDHIPAQGERERKGLANSFQLSEAETTCELCSRMHRATSSCRGTWACIASSLVSTAPYNSCSVDKGENEFPWARQNFWHR